MVSVWSKTSELPRFGALNKDLKTDVLIIGGGITGILCAYFLENCGVNYALVEADTICSGITKNTTAKITSQHGFIYDKLINEFGVEKARMYFDANDKALLEYKRLCENIDCGFECKDSFVYSCNSDDKIEAELKALEQIGLDAVLEEKHPLPFPILGAIKFSDQAQFNPLQFISSLCKDLNIYENTRVIEIRDNEALTEKFKIKADKFIVASHFPFMNKHGSYFLKMYQHRSYVLALENAPDVNGMYVDEEREGLSFRNYDDLLLIGGGSHRTGKTGGNWEELKKFATRNYKNANEKYRWATQDCMTLDGVPYIGRYSKHTPNVYVATGYNKWGMTSSMAAAMILADLVTGKDNPYVELFSPSRTIMRPQLLANTFEAVSNLVKFTKKRCPHLGCALQWNSVEHTWDCPCHGSRFGKDGTLIDNPATGDLKSK